MITALRRRLATWLMPAPITPVKKRKPLHISDATLAQFREPSQMGEREAAQRAAGREPLHALSPATAARLLAEHLARKSAEERRDAEGAGIVKNDGMSAMLNGISPRTGRY